MKNIAKAMPLVNVSALGSLEGEAELLEYEFKNCDFFGPNRPN